jgi:membrane protein YqaA with SNARE-associated domain
MELWGLFLSAFVSATLAPGGSEAILAYLVVNGDYKVNNLVFVATLGNTLGAATTWGLGMLAAKKYPLVSLLPKEKRKALDIVKTKGIWALFFSWLPIIGDALCFAGGWLKLPILTSFLAIMIGKFCRYVVVVWLLIA